MDEIPIWPTKTGITDIEGDPNDLSASQIPGIKAVWKDQRERLKDSEQLSDFNEKLSREWAIETGIIENLYDIDRGVTQTLIERGFQAELLVHGSTNKPPGYVIDLLQDQKSALDGIFDFVKGNRDLSVSYIKELHAALLRSQQTTEAIDSQGRHVEVNLIKGDWKDQPNHPIRDGVAFTYCPPEQVGSEMERLIDIHLGHVAKGISSEVKAAWLHHRFTQIHPFQDGNGRVARAIASLVLIRDELFPLVVTRDQRAAYIGALEAADSGNLAPLIDITTGLQIVQFNRASAISHAVLEEQDVQAALDGLSLAADKIAAERREKLKGVFKHAKKLESDVESRLREISVDVEATLQKVQPNAWASVSRSESHVTDHYFRSQVIEIAKKHIGYFADTSEYRSWVSLIMHWSRHAQLVFCFHGVGKPFNGSLICAPFLEFRDRDDEENVRSALVPLSEDGFVFFYNEDESKMISRFASWRDNVIKVALKELSQNL